MLMTARDYWRMELFMSAYFGGSVTIYRGRIERVASDWLRFIVLDASVPQN